MRRLLSMSRLAPLDSGARSARERALAIQPHQGLGAGGEARTAARDRRRLHRLEQLALARAVLDGALHVGDDEVLVGAAEREDRDDHHLAVLERQRLALADGEIGERLPRL